MKLYWKAAAGALALSGTIGVAWWLYGVPAMLTLREGIRPGLEDLTIEAAAERLRSSGSTGWALVDQARRSVGQRMQYCRRNSFEPHQTAFRRGHGFCQQQAYALVDLLRQLGFDARPVYSTRCRFPDAIYSGHTWVRVTCDGATREIDWEHMDPTGTSLTFVPLRQVAEMGPLFCAFSAWGSAGVNAYRYYRTGRDIG